MTVSPSRRMGRVLHFAPQSWQVLNANLAASRSRYRRCHANQAPIALSRRNERLRMLSVLVSPGSCPCVALDVYAGRELDGLTDRFGGASGGFGHLLGHATKISPKLDGNDFQDMRVSGKAPRQKSTLDSCDDLHCNVALIQGPVGTALSRCNNTAHSP